MSGTSSSMARTLSRCVAPCSCKCGQSVLPIDFFQQIVRQVEAVRRPVVFMLEDVKSFLGFQNASFSFIPTGRVQPCKPMLI
jgi:hypothetical protein